MATATTLFNFVAGSEFSPCRNYRYTLWRRWDWAQDLDRVLFIGYRASLVDELDTDSLMDKYERLAKSWNYGGIIVMNAYAAVSPSVPLREAIGPLNDQWIKKCASEVALVVATWGADCSKKRQNEIIKLVEKPIYCLGRTMHGNPRNPLKIPVTEKLEAFSYMGKVAVFD